MALGSTKFLEPSYKPKKKVLVLSDLKLQNRVKTLTSTKVLEPSYELKPCFELKLYNSVMAFGSTKVLQPSYEVKSSQLYFKQKA